MRRATKNMDARLPSKRLCECGEWMTLRRGRRAGGLGERWYKCAACGADDRGDPLRLVAPKAARLLAARSKPGRAVKLLLPLLTDWA
jgi:hypothetical protein